MQPTIHSPSRRYIEFANKEYAVAGRPQGAARIDDNEYASHAWK
jgi:hypothetical protein